MTLPPLIRSVRLAGWRSFEHGAGIQIPMSQTTVIIGANNAGKSNIGKFLVWLRGVLKISGDDPWNPSSQPAVRYKVPIAEGDFWSYVRQPIICTLEIEASSERGRLGSCADMFLNDGYATVEIKVTPWPDINSAEISFMPITRDGYPMVNEKGVFMPGNQYVEYVPNSHGHAMFGMFLAKRFASSLVDIQPLRDYLRQRTDLHSSSFDGGALVSMLERARKGPRNTWQEIRSDLERWLGRLLGESSPPGLDVATDGVRVSFRTGARLQMDLQDLGTGVAEVVMLLAFLRLQSDRRLLAIIDEPEAHLHPGAAVELMRILVDDLSNTQVLATTHATSIINVVSKSWSVLKANRSESGATRMSLLETNGDRFQLAKELGLDASQLFLVHAVLWIEGPSDAIYLRRLLRESNPDLIEGRDFGFAMYGGALMTHLTFDPDGTDHIVRLLQISSNPILIADRDTDSESCIRKVLVSLEETSSEVRVWRTPGREIENCILSDRLVEAVRSDPFRLKLENGSLSRVLLPAEISVSENDAFDMVLSAGAYVNGAALTPKHRERIRESLNQRKVKISTAVCELAGQVFTSDARRWGKSLSDALFSQRKC